MKQILVFGVSSLALVVAALVVAWTLTSREVWVWLAAAGGTAFVAQIAVHLALQKWRQNPETFFKAVVAGAALRFLMVAGGLTWVAVTEPAHPVAFLLGFVGFLVGMLLIESGLENTNRFRPGFAASDPAVRG